LPLKRLVLGVSEKARHNVSNKGKLNMDFETIHPVGKPRHYGLETFVCGSVQHTVEYIREAKKATRIH
jgi:hypothetical protein